MKEKFVKHLSMGLTDEDYEKLRALSECYNKPMTEVMRTCINDTYLHASWLGMIKTHPWDDENSIKFLRERLDKICTDIEEVVNNNK